MTAAKRQPEDSEQEIAFEKLISGLETIVSKLEAGDLPLEESLREFERGIQLAREGTRRLDAAEQRVDRLLERDGHVETRPWSAETSGTNSGD